MDEKTAYCCLNCTTSANCCGTCGECPECCKDCRDTSKCKATAYFDGISFYKDYIYTAIASSSFMFEDQLGGYPGVAGGYENYTSIYDTSKKIPCSKNGSSQYLFDGAYYDKSVWTYNGATTTSKIDFEDCENQDDNGNEIGCPRIATGPSDCINGGPITETQCSTPEECYNCIYEVTCGPACCGPFGGCGYCENPTIYRATGKYKTKIDFINPLKLYDKKGKDVGNIIGANYNPNTHPESSWAAPQCHFFAP
jgi:hypothetical protein